MKMRGVDAIIHAACTARMVEFDVVLSDCSRYVFVCDFVVLCIYVLAEMLF